MRRRVRLLFTFAAIALVLTSLRYVEAANSRQAVQRASAASASNPCSYDLAKQLNYSAPKTVAAATMAATVAAAQGVTMDPPVVMTSNPPVRGAAKHVLILFIDGGHPEFYTQDNTPTIMVLSAQGTTFCNARTGFPSDSMPGILDVFTGAPPSVSGFLYDVSYDRHYNMQITVAEDPQTPKGVDMRNLVRIPTLFQAIHAAKMRASFISKHAGYAILEGPTWAGAGFDKGDLYLPEEADYNFDSKTEKFSHQAFDQANWDTLTKLVDGANPPALFGAYILGPNYTVKNGWTDKKGNLLPATVGALQYEDTQLGKLIAEMKSKGIYDSTAIIITADHGNTPLTRWVPEDGERSISQFLAQNGIEVLSYTPDDLYMVWLKDESQTAKAIDLLSTPDAKAKFGTNKILNQSDLAELGAAPADRTPDFIVIPTDGQNGTDSVVYAGGPKLSEHGGISEADQRVPLFMAGAGIRKGYVSQTPINNMALGPTMAYLLGVDMPYATTGPLFEALGK